jgi:hypothetical protein
VTPEPHAYGCQCEQCRSMMAAISAMEGDEYFFTDADLGAIAQQHNKRCGCALCEDLRAGMAEEEIAL